MLATSLTTARRVIVLVALVVTAASSDVPSLQAQAARGR